MSASIKRVTSAPMSGGGAGGTGPNRGSRAGADSGPRQPSAASGALRTGGVPRPPPHSGCISSLFDTPLMAAVAGEAVSGAALGVGGTIAASPSGAAAAVQDASGIDSVVADESRPAVSSERVGDGGVDVDLVLSGGASGLGDDNDDDAAARAHRAAARARRKRVRRPSPPLPCLLAAGARARRRGYVFACMFTWESVGCCPTVVPHLA